MVTRQAFCRVDSFRRIDGKQDGFLRAKVYPTKVGVFKYRDRSGKIIRELRPPEEVHKKDSLVTLENKSHTNNHPPELVNSRNSKKYQTGVIVGKHDVAEDNIHTVTEVLVTDEDNIVDIIEKGKTKVSCGYTCRIDETSGVWEGQEYDQIQRDINYNHLSSVWNPRAGDGAEFKVDSEGDEIRFDAVEVEECQNKSYKEKKRMDKIRIDGREFEVDQAVEIAYSSFKKRVDGEIETLSKNLKTETDKNAKLQAKLDEADEKAKRVDSFDFEAEISSRMSVREDARKILGTEFKFDGMSNQEVYSAVLKKARPNLKLDDKSDVYIKARYDGVIEDGLTVDPVIANQKKPIEQKLDGADEGYVDPLLAQYRKDAEDLYTDKESV